MTVHDIDVAHNIWGKSFPYFKRNTTRNKPIPVSGDLVQVLEELAKLHRNIYLTADMLFVNSTLFFITPNRKIYFTAINISNIKVKTILKAFKEIYIYYTKRGFHITNIHPDG